MIFIDAGYLAALIREGDELHDRAHRWAQTVVEDLVLTDYVIVETVNGLSHPKFRLRVNHLIESLRTDDACDVVIVDEPLLDAGLALHRDRPDKAWSLTDCISFVVMEERGITRALAYDRHFEQAGFEALLRRDP